MAAILIYGVATPGGQKHPPASYKAFADLKARLKSKE